METKPKVQKMNQVAATSLKKLAKNPLLDSGKKVIFLTKIVYLLPVLPLLVGIKNFLAEKENHLTNSRERYNSWRVRFYICRKNSNNTKTIIFSEFDPLCFHQNSHQQFISPPSPPTLFYILSVSLREKTNICPFPLFISNIANKAFLHLSLTSDSER